MSNGFHVIIPARLASTRLPDKPLADLGGKPLVVRVLERAAASSAASVQVATDSERVANVVRRHGGHVVMTDPGHRSGTDRLSETVSLLGLDDDVTVVNLQGDEPGMPPACIDQVARLLQQSMDAHMATLWWPVADEQEWRNPNVVKLVAGAGGEALYFSRSPIPYPRDGGWPDGVARRHIGLYAYRVSALKAWPDLPDSPLEQLESLEQLRALESGWTIACARAVKPIPAGIDTPEDLAAAVAALADPAHDNR